MRPAKLATVFSRSTALIVHPSSRTTDGVWILAEPCVWLSADVSDDALGEAVLAALAASRTDVPHPTNWKGVLQPLLAVAGVTTWAAFAKSALCVHVSLDGDGDDTMHVTPTANLGAREGFEELQAESAARSRRHRRRRPSGRPSVACSRFLARPALLGSREASGHDN